MCLRLSDQVDGRESGTNFRKRRPEITGGGQIVIIYMTVTCKHLKSVTQRSKEISSELLLRRSLPISGRQNFAHHEK